LRAIGGSASVRKVINMSGRTTVSSGSLPSSLISWRDWVGGSMTRRGRLIVFLGPVGVGKSTVIKGLAYVLKARGFRTYRTFIKAFHGPAYILWVLIVKLLGLSVNSKYSPWLLIQRSGRIVLARKLLVLSIYLDAFISIPLKIIIVRVLRRFGYYVLSEEYLQSSLLDHIFTAINLKIKTNFSILSIPISIEYALLNKYSPDVTIVLMTNIHELKRRWVIRGYGEPQLRYVLLQYAFFNKLNNAVRIDTTGMGIKETLDKVLEIFSVS
jgi:energy-coupling factor transporter ATP-binding protein EcfA2